jgi:hypothetical protein
LETLSQVRAELIASYIGHPTTAWLPTNVIWSRETFRNSIPKHLLSQIAPLFDLVAGVFRPSPDLIVAKFYDRISLKNGALAIERRWIDVELPDYEVLDALARVYGQLALMTISLHEHCCVLIPEKSSGLGEHFLRDLMPDGRLPSMSRPFDDRGIYIAVKDGSFLGHRREFRTTDTEKARKVVKR